MEQLRRLRPGMVVWDVGHHRVGTVADVGDESFELVGAEGRLHRLRAEALYWVGSGTATLVCNESGLGQYAA